MKYGKEKLKYYHDRQGTKELPPLKPGDFVRVKPETRSKEWKAATVVQQHTSPRSYIVDVGGRRIRRNRMPPMPDTRMEKLPLDYQSDQSVTRKSPARKIPPSPEVAATRGSTLYTTRSGRQVKKPVKLDL